MKKKIFLFLLVSMSVLFFAAGCGSGSSEKASGDKGKEEGANGDGFYQKLQEKGKIEVGATPSGPPFTFLNTKTNEIDGYMVDIANAIGKDLDLDVNVNSVQWTSLIPSIDAEKIDMVAAAMAITEERKEVLDFSDPVYTYGESIIVLKDNDDIKTVDDLEGLKVGVQEASIYYNGLVKRPEVNIQTYKTHQDMTKELNNGRIDAFMADYPVFKELLKELPDVKDKVKIVQPEDPLWVAEIGIAFPKGATEFQKEINRVLKEMESSGEKEKLIEKWDLN